MGKKISWRAGWQTTLFTLAFSPVYALFRLVFKRSLILIVTPQKDDTVDASIFRNTYDYVRCRTLGFLAEDIQTKFSDPVCRAAVEDGTLCVAELGVYRGDFASRINFLFPDCHLYLFDTFSGFAPADKEADFAANCSQASWHNKFNDFKDTDVETVLKKMPHREKCIVRQGHFPESLLPEDSALKFAYVSIDVDLYQPMLEGLRFFYPRLAEGGAMMLHDYNCPSFTGCHKAVIDFEKENGPLRKVPLCDTSGSLIILR